MRKIRKLMAANRSEIAIRVFRAAHELGIRTVAIYSYEDRYALHRLKADEAYPVGKPGEPVRAYLDIPSILGVAKEQDVDAIHPGYGFLSETPNFARACAEAGILFVGPRPELLEALGDKTEARRIAQKAGIPVLPGTERPVDSLQEAADLATDLGYPVILKAAYGGGGRGMRVVQTPEDLPAAFEQAHREAALAFGNGALFVEKYLPRARHIEVQLLGDKYGNLVHLWERDCSIQRRHQKVVEIAPAINLPDRLRQAICEGALTIGRYVRYENAGTVEFLLDLDTGKFYFIEVNPRIQVEHTVTEQITGIDIVQCQILIAEGLALDDPEIGITSQEKIKTHGFAFQCRVTTEDPERNFMPDYGKITHYRSPGGLGIRLDAGQAFTGAVITPYYDSLLVKVTAWGERFLDAVRRMERALQEFRVRGVKTNIPFLINLVNHPDFSEGRLSTRFIEERPELFRFVPRLDRASKLMAYLGHVIVNGNPVVRGRPKAQRKEPPPVPQFDHRQPPPPGMRQRLQQMGPVAFARWVREQKAVLVTDTTFRDAHQSLLATRMRTYDMLRIAPAYARLASGLFSIEMWGGATFDTAMRFLKECPWERLVELRHAIPNILFQMLLRASNAVGYAAYPDDVVRAFVQEAAEAGIDLFRIFDAFNWLPNLRFAIETVLETGALCEAALCYTGDILNPKRSKYSLKYYVELARELEKLGIHFLAIKDMAGLCKPYAAERLIRALREEVEVPIHFHTHDTSGAQMAALLKAAEAGVDVVDAAMAPLSGLTSQPNLNALVEALRFTERDTGLDYESLSGLARYWEAVRQFYTAFESDLRAPTAEVYRHEIPGGQYTNLREQAQAVGLGHRWDEVCRAYAEVNQFLGDIIKVTPTSKAVGDLALFLVANGLSTADLLDPDRAIAFPASVVDLVSGKMGQPPGGFPPEVQRRILQDRPPMTGRPGAELPPADFEAARQKVAQLLGRPPHRREVVSYLMYPKVYEEFVAHRNKYSDTSVMPTPVFFYGMEPGEEAAIEIEPGKTLFFKFLAVGDPHPDGHRTVFFEVNGQPRETTVVDLSLEQARTRRCEANPNDPREVAAPMAGLVVRVAVRPGDHVRRGQPLLFLEAMKMQTAVHAPMDARVEEVLVSAGTQVDANELVLRLAP
jgi:pyruvate carboxylase